MSSQIAIQYGFAPIKFPKRHFTKEAERKGLELLYKLKFVEENNGVITAECMPSMRKAKGTIPYKLTFNVSCL